MTDQTISFIDLNYTSLIYRNGSRMRCAIKALILILLCQAPFAVGLNILPSGFRSIFPDSSVAPKAHQAFNAKTLAELLTSFQIPSSRAFAFTESGIAGNFGMIPPSFVVPSPVVSPPAINPVSADLDIWPTPSFIPSPIRSPLPDSELFDDPDFVSPSPAASPTNLPDTGIDHDPDQDIPPPSYLDPSSPHASPDRDIVQDPTALPQIPFNGTPKKIIMEIRPDNASHKYVIEEQLDPDYDLLTVIRKTIDPDGLPEPEIGSRQEEFELLLLKPGDPIFFLEDRELTGQAPIVHTVSSGILNYLLMCLINQGAKYVVIYKDDGTIMVKVRYANGTIRILSQEELLFKFGEWFNDFLDSFMEFLYGYATPYTTYSYQSDSVVISHKKKRKPAKGDPQQPDSQSVDGQNGSKPSSGRASPNTPALLTVKRPTTERQMSAPDPGPSHHKTEVGDRGSKDDGATLVVPEKTRTKPEHRFTVAKATSELAVSGQHSQGVNKLAKAIKRGELKAKFKTLDGFPKLSTVRNQIRWLLTHGHAIPLSELIVEKANQQWLDVTAHTLLNSHLQRAKSTRRTRLQSSNSLHQHAGLSEQLDTFITEEVVAVGRVKPKDQAVLKPLLKNGWRILFANGKKAPLYNSAQQRKLLNDAKLAGAKKTANPNGAKTESIDDVLTVSTQWALEFLLWDAAEAARVSKLISQIVSPTFDAQMKQALESTPTQPGMIEHALDIANYVRLVDHPTAGGGRVVVGPSQRHITVSYHNNEAIGEHVLIEVSIEFSEITIANPMQEQVSIPLAMGLKTVYQLPSRSVTATRMPNRVIVASNPTLPPPPSAEQIEQWTRELHDKQAQLFNDSLEKTEERLRNWETRVSHRPPVDIAKLKEDSRKLKLAQQRFADNYNYARNWSDLSAERLERVSQALSDAMKKYLQLLDSALENESLYNGSSHKQGWQLVRDYRKYVQDMEAVYRQMEEINKRRHELTQNDLAEIERLAKMTETIGGRARAIEADELPVRRTQLEKDGKLTQEQYDRTEELRTLYYPLTSAFNIVRVQALHHSSQQTDETDYHRASTFIPEDEHGVQPVISTAPELSPMEVTLPFTFTDSSQGDFEADIPLESITHDLDPDSSALNLDDGDEDGSDEEESPDSDD